MSSRARSDSKKKPFVILMAEDDKDYYHLTKVALKQAHLTNDLVWVSDGEECMEYLLRRGKFSYPENAPTPGIVLLDLNMPKKNGLETLKEIKSHVDLKQIPVVIMTISTTEEDILNRYSLGANSFIRKPFDFNKLLDIVRTFHHYWLEIVELPKVDPG